MEPKLKNVSNASADGDEKDSPNKEILKGSTSGTKTLDEALHQDEGMLDSFLDDEDDSDDSDSYDEMSDMDENDEQKFIFEKASFKVMTEAEVRQCLENDIKITSDLLCIPKDEAVVVLLHFKWDVQAVSEKWFENSERLREEIGLLEKPAVTVEAENTEDMTCGTCSRTFPGNQLAAASCGHKFCKTCWQDFFEKSLGEDLGCLILRCPDPSCKIVVTPDMITLLASEQVKNIYDRNFHRSFIELKDKAKWCPAPNCSNAVFLVTNRSLCKVTCNCLHTFCWECMKEAHEPTSCDFVKRWVTEKELMKQKWNIENSRKCPKCQVLITFSGCYKHMECIQCNFHFCRDCCRGWMEHGRWEGESFRHQCYPSATPTIGMDGDARRREIEKGLLMRYLKYEAQWKMYDMDQQLAVRMIRKLQSSELKVIAVKQGLAEEEMNFVTEAWLQIADCKRIVKWIVVYDYYLNPFRRDLKDITDYLLKRASFVMQQLYQRVADLTMFVELNGASPIFGDFRDKVLRSTSVARNYFENMVWAMQSWPVLSVSRYVMGILRTKLRWKFRVSPPVKQPPTQDAGPSTPMTKCGDGLGYRTCSYCLFENDVYPYICLMCYH